MPIYRGGELTGYQLRKIEAADKRPKYLTMANVKPLFWTSALLSSSVLVITEDILSGIKCSRFHNSLALLTATPNDTVIEWIVKQSYTSYIIFLDNDNRQVKQSQVALKNRLSLFGDATIIHADKDPKEHSNRELEELLL